MLYFILFIFCSAHTLFHNPFPYPIYRWKTCPAPLERFKAIRPNPCCTGWFTLLHSFNTLHREKSASAELIALLFSFLFTFFFYNSPPPDPLKLTRWDEHTATTHGELKAVSLPVRQGCFRFSTKLNSFISGWQMSKCPSSPPITTHPAQDTHQEGRRAACSPSEACS